MSSEIINVFVLHWGVFYKINSVYIVIEIGEGFYTAKKPWASKYSVVQNTFEWRRENALGIYIFATLASLWLVGYDT